ncbi:MAG: glutathione S-transferase family protein [Rhodoblastus sp.]
MRIYGDLGSGNCLKVKYTADRLGLAYEWIAVDLKKSQTRTKSFLAKNRFGEVPLVEFADGRRLAQSNAIIAYLARDTALLPQDAFARAKVDEWLFWEQYSHEPYVAVARFQMVYLGKKLEEREARVVERAEQALGVLEEALSGRTYLVGDDISVADISLLAYTRLAHEGGFRLSHRPAIRKWIAQCESDLNISLQQPAAAGGARHG